MVWYYYIGMTDIGRESVTELELDHESLKEIDGIFEAADEKFIDALARDQDTPSYIHYILRGGETDGEPLARIGLVEDHEEFMRHGGSDLYTELTLPVIMTQDRENPYISLLGKENASRFLQVVLRRGFMYEALKIANLKVDNFGSGETAAEHDAILNGPAESRTPLEPHERLRAVKEIIQKGKPVPIRVS